MICMQCGQVYEKGKFCVKCGVPLSEQPTQEAPVESAAAMEGQLGSDFTLGSGPASAMNPPSAPLPTMTPAGSASSSANTPAQAAVSAPSVASTFNPASSTVASSTSTGSDVPQGYTGYGSPSPSAPQEVPAMPSMANGWNQIKQSQFMQQGTQISKQFGNFYIKALMHPFMTAKNVGKPHFTNGMLTIFLTSLLLPLVLYIPGLIEGYGDYFGKRVLRPFLLIWIALLLASAIAFAAIRLGRIATDFMTVTAKLGTMLVPATASLVLCMLIFVLDFGDGFSLFLMLVSLTLIIGAITATVLSFRKESINGLDPLYGAIIANLAFGYILVKFANLSLGFGLGGLF